MNKKLLTGIVLCGMVAGAANAIYYRGSGAWETVGTGAVGTTGWNSALPNGLGVQADLRLGNAVTLDYAAPTVGQFWLGKGRAGYGDDRWGTLTVLNGGSLSALNISVGYEGADSTLGGNADGTVFINAGGTLTSLDTGNIGNGHGSPGVDAGTGFITVAGAFNADSHLWFGRGGGSGTMTIQNGGVVTVGGAIGLGTSDGLNPSGGTGTLTVESGGLLALNSWNFDGTNSIQSGSVLNINGTGAVTLNGDYVASADSYIALGRIATDQPGLLATYDGVGTTTIVAIPEPATLGLVAAFGGGLFFIRRWMKI